MSATNEIILLCAPPGTCLREAVSYLESDHRRLVIDVEDTVCDWYKESTLGGKLQSGHPRMDMVVRRPRHELTETWSLAYARILESIVDQNPSNPAVVSLHLTWYNPDTSEFFSPIDFSKFVRDDCSVVHVVILIDDIYDMYYRLRQDQQLYADDFMMHHRYMLSKQVEEVDKGDDPCKLEKTLQRQVIELALGELLSWRRSEMIQAENIARALNARLTLIGIKHHKRSLQEIISHPNAPRIYLSHRITEHRRHNMSTRTKDNLSGYWLPVVTEVHTLHREFLKAGQVLINPTAIDELRFALGNSKGQRDPRLGGRWPLAVPEQELLWSRPHPDRGPEHTMILIDDDPSDIDHDDVSRSIATSLANRIYFEIAFRDHLIVENTPNLCVYRPFFCVNMSEATSKAEWSSGVRREIKHWRDSHRNRAIGLPSLSNDIQNDHDIRRLAFIHTTDEIKCRVRWLLIPKNFRIFLGNARRHLEKNWENMGMPHAEISSLLAQKIPSNPAVQLGRSPDNTLVRQKPKEVLSQIWPAIQTALYLEFASINRPGTSEDLVEDIKIGSDQIAFYLITEDIQRVAVNLPGLVHKLSLFFSGSLDERTVTNLNSDFWSECGRCFEIETGISFEQYVAQKIGIDYVQLQRLADESD